jgi:hypothetical protein
MVSEFASYTIPTLNKRTKGVGSSRNWEFEGDVITIVPTLFVQVIRRRGARRKE